MAAEGEVHHAADLDAAMMTRPVAGRGSEGSVWVGRLRALPSGFHHHGSAARSQALAVDGGASGESTAQESPLGRVEREAARSPAHAFASGYAGVRVPDHIAGARNRLARR